MHPVLYGRKRGGVQRCPDGAMARAAATNGRPQVKVCLLVLPDSADEDDLIPADSGLPRSKDQTQGCLSPVPDLLVVLLLAAFPPLLPERSWSRDRPLCLASRSLPLTATIFGTRLQPLPPLAFRQPSEPTLSMGWANHTT
ncbi:hypothetical protein VTN02DRAFT_6072 [Thermoascus thermophilus]